MFIQLLSDEGYEALTVSLYWGLGTWNLEFGTWNLELEILNAGFPIAFLRFVNFRFAFHFISLINWMMLMEFL
jgi:hypothetical protein